MRVSFTGTPASAVWSDTLISNWMDPGIPFSLANFWKVSTFHQIDLSFVLLPPVVLDDPRDKNNLPDRINLVNAVIKEVDRAARPDWSQIDRCIIFFSQPTDAFGGGPFQLPNGKWVPVSIFDESVRFDSICQESGHMFGLHHELGAWHYGSGGAYTNEYGCPYSVMSAEGDHTFERALDPRLPGVAGTSNPQRVIGPYVPTAHLYLNPYHPADPNGAFMHPDTVKHLPANYLQTPATVRLIARDAAIAAWPTRRPVLAVVPPIIPGGDTHFLELRRKVGYDAGIDNASIVILATNFFVGNARVADTSALRLRYVGRIDVEGVEGDFDYHSFSGDFVVRVTSVDDDFGGVNLSIAGGNAWQSFAVTLDTPLTYLAPASTSDWSTAVVAACPGYSKREYSYRVKTFGTYYQFRAHSFGYEKPHYTWYLENVKLDFAESIGTDVEVLCREVSGHEITPPAVHRVTIGYVVNAGKLEIMIKSPFADILLNVKVTVNETSPGVMKNYYPDRSILTTVRADNVKVEWDSEYQAAFENCWKAISDVNTRFQEAVGPLPPWDQIGVREIIRTLAERDPRSAYAVAAEVAGRAGVPTENVLEEIFRTSALTG